MSDHGVQREQERATALEHRRATGVLFPNHYAWYILAATLDVVVTHQILHHFKGSEVNQLADTLIRRFGLAGMIGLKYSSIVLVVILCEYIGRRDLRLGRRLAAAAIMISALPVGIGLLQIWAWTHAPPAMVDQAIDPVIEDAEFP